MKILVNRGISPIDSFWEFWRIFRPFSLNKFNVNRGIYVVNNGNKRNFSPIHMLKIQIG